MHLAIDQQITFLYTKDLSTSIRFYEHVLQLPLVLDQGGCRIYGITETAYLGICQRENATINPQGVIFTFVVSDVDGWYAHMCSHGVSFENTPAINDTYGIYHCFAKDPNGYLIEIQRFLDPDWNK